MKKMLLPIMAVTLLLVVGLNAPAMADHRGCDYGFSLGYGAGPANYGYYSPGYAYPQSYFYSSQPRFSAFYGQPYYYNYRQPYSYGWPYYGNSLNYYRPGLSLSFGFGGGYFGSPYYGRSYFSTPYLHHHHHHHH